MRLTRSTFLALLAASLPLAASAHVGVDGAAHHSAEGIHFGDDLRLAWSPDGRVARHVADAVEVR